MMAAVAVGGCEAACAGVGAARAFLTASERSASSVGAIGIMLPMTQMTKVVSGVRPIHAPTGTPPRSSTAGSIETSTRIAQSGRPVPRKKSASFWPRCRCSPAADEASASAGVRRTEPATSAAVRRSLGMSAGCGRVSSSGVAVAAAAAAVAESCSAGRRRATGAARGCSSGAVAWKPAAAAKVARMSRDRNDIALGNDCVVLRSD